MWLFILGVLLLNGCSLNTTEMLTEFSKSERSWCVNAVTTSGTIQAGGTGLPNGKMTCTREGWTIESGKDGISPSQQKK